MARIIHCQRKFKEAKRKQQIHQSPTLNVKNQVEVTAQETQSMPRSQGYAKVRLPQQMMPRFKGDLAKWNSFGDSLNVSIHENNRIFTIDFLTGKKRSASNTQTAFD